MKNKLLLTLLALGVSGAAIANTPAPQETGEKTKTEQRKKKDQRHKKYAEKMWEYSDKDKDGKVSKEEALMTAGEMFDKVDANKDGFVTKEERKEYYKKIQKQKRHHHSDDRVHKHRGDKAKPAKVKEQKEVTPEVKNEAK